MGSDDERYLGMRRLTCALYALLFALVTIPASIALLDGNRALRGDGLLTFLFVVALLALGARKLWSWARPLGKRPSPALAKEQPQRPALRPEL